MRYLFTCLLLICFGTHAQTNRFIKAGRPLVIGKGIKITNKEVAYSLSGLTRYRGVETVWLYNVPEHALDTILQRVDRDINPRRLIIEKCKLTYFPELRATRLHALEIRQGNSVDLMALCSSFQSSPLKELQLYTKTLQFDLDSLGLLDSLVMVKLTDDPSTRVMRGRMPYYITNKGITRSIQLAYYGNLKTPEEEFSLTEVNQTLYKSEFNTVKQPISSTRINDTVIVAESNKPIEFLFKSGSNISITPNSLIYEDGKPFNGIAIISYREFRNEIDIALSGIPMTNTENGETKLFRSGGMYEISARDKNGRTLLTKNDSCVQVNYATSDTASDFAIYQLNNQQWTKTPQTVVPVKRSRIDSLTPAELAYYENISRKPIFRDTTKMHDRFNSTRYYYIYDSTWFKSWGSKKAIKSRTRHGILFTNKGRLKDRRRVIYVESVYALTDWNIPYMRPFINRYYVVQDGKTRIEIRNLSNRQVQDARVEEQGGDLVFMVKTLKGFDTLRLTALKSFQNGKREENYQLHKQLMKRYNRILTHTAKKFDRPRRNPRNAFSRFSFASYNQNTRMPDTMLYFGGYQVAYPLMNKEEKGLSRKQFHERVISKLRALSYQNFGISALNNVLIKSGMGISNIDCYLHAGQMETIYAKVQYSTADSSYVDATVVVFRDIKTSSPAQTVDRNLYQGYHFYKGESYMVQFFDDRYMTVYKLERAPNSMTKPLIYKKGNPVDVYGMSSDQVRDLIYSTN